MSTDTPIEQQGKQATVEELCESTLRHYEDISLRAHHWSNQVPQAIRYWYLEKPKLERELAALRADTALLDWMGSLGADTDITICPPGNHGGPGDKWLVSIENDKLLGPIIEAYGDTPRAALAACATKGKRK